MPYEYRTIEPMSKKSSYTSYDDPTFQLDFENMKLKQNSIRISGTLGVRYGGTALNGQDVRFDGLAGIHGFFDGFVISFDTGKIETITDYGRIAHTKFEAQNNNPEACSESHNAVELRCSADEQSKSLMRDDQTFCFMPDFALNNMSGDMSYKKSGSVQITCRFAPLANCLFGTAATFSTNTTFSIINLQLHYEVVPEDGNNNDVILGVKSMIRQDVNSSNHNLATKAPVVASAVSVSFAKMSNLSSYLNSQYKSEVPPSVSRLIYNFNDSNQYVSFPMDNREEILYNGILALGGNADSDVVLGKLDRMALESDQGENGGAVPSGYLAGLPLPNPVDFSNQKLAIQIESGITNANKYSCFVLFLGSIKV